MSLKLHHINEDYIKHLMLFDNKVTLFKDSGRARPYTGIVFFINGYNYFAPLSSPKKDASGKLLDSYKNKFGKNNNPLYEKIENLKYGTIQINNMVPVPDSELIEFDINLEPDTNYKTILLDEFIYIDDNKIRILKKAQKLYKYVTISKNDMFVNMSCNFKLLEVKCSEYSTYLSNNKITK